MPQNASRLGAFGSGRFHFIVWQVRRCKARVMTISSSQRQRVDGNRAGPSKAPPPPPAPSSDSLPAIPRADSQTEAYNYVVTAHRPSAVTESLVATFTGPKDINLIVSKCLRIEIHRLLPDGLQGIADVPIYGRVVQMRVRSPMPHVAMLSVC
jgi:hypothetical protein